VIRKDGSRFWSYQVLTAIYNNAADKIGFAAKLRDATSWKQVQQDRDQLFRLSRDLIGVAGSDGYFKRVNPSFTRVLGYPASELLSKPYAAFVHPDDLAATRTETRSLSSGKVTEAFQNRYRCSDGTFRWLEWTATSSPEDGHVYAVARDVTEQKAVEKKLQEYAKELERSNEDLQQFAYVASHDLQEPLRAIAGCVQMLDERNVGKLDERSQELMRHAVDGAKRLQTLIHDLLTFSRIGSGGLSKSFVDASAAIDRALVQLAIPIEESHAVVRVEPLPRAWVDVAQLIPLFQNLIANAIKFRTEKRPEIHISALERPGEVLFSVRDNGIGIAPEYYERVFGVFQRLNSRRDYPGTGIGLAICKKIVERHGGQIWIESRPNEGTTFLFTIPNDITR
jgi:PAS domain S-box-containing protein